MNKQAKRLAVHIIYGELAWLLAQYEATSCFNEVPAGAPETNVQEYLENRLQNIRRSAAVLFSRDLDTGEKAERVIGETEFFLKQYEMPGVVRRWKELNPNLTFFDCAFDLITECPEEFDKMRMGLSPTRLACYPDKKDLRRRKAYFAAVRRRFARANREYSEEAVFQDELCRTLERVFRTDFREVWTGSKAGA